jgi:glycosyltransferase involved in cell wall biosynthesis
MDFETDWSRVPVGLSEGLAELGVDTRYWDATPYVPGAKYLRRWLPTGGDGDQGWLLRPEMVAVARASGAMRRLLSRSDATGWVHLLSPVIGRPVRGRYVTFEDLTVAQMQKSGQWFKFSDRRFGRWRRLQADVYRHAKACCAVSTWTKASIVEDFGVPEAKIRLVGLGRNLTLPAVESRDWSSPRFLFVGRDWPRKNGDAVVRAFARLIGEHPDARLDLVGCDPDVSLPGVFRHGHLDQRDPVQGPLLRELYATATCFVMPSFAEPFAIAYLEAASAGLPVIATTVGGIRDALGSDGALYVDPHDDDAIYGAMRRLCDPQVAQAMGRAAERRARDYTWRNVAQRVLDAILD